MAPPSALRATRCSACSLSALRLFVGHIAEAQARTSAATAAKGSRRFAPAHSAAFSTFRPTARLLGSPAIEERLVEPPRSSTNSNSSSNSETPDPTPSPPPATSDVPWYLQVEPPRHPTLLHAPSPLPPMPSDSPKVLDPLLHYISDELGLDALTLLDLRPLDPPAALGPDLIMLLGTARSERHLHVSADRLVRWLRGRGISAKADGLLGRNELKTKLRRAARKAKLLGTSATAARAGRGGDDGISTGWICVNLGMVGGSHREEVLVDEEGRPTGFGVPQTGTTIVVQMMTEGRREELDLEKLWNGKLRRSLERAEPAEVLEAPETVAAGAAGSARMPALDGRRAFSTSARRPVDVVTASETNLSDVVLNSFNESAAIAQATQILHNDAKSKLQILGQLQSYFGTLTEEQADEALVKAEGVHASGFLRLYERALDKLAPTEAWEHRLWLWNTARSRDVPGYDLGIALAWLRQIQFTTVNLSRETCLQLLGAVFAVPAQNDAAVRDQSALAMQIIDTMFTRGEKVLNTDVLVTVIETLVRHPSPAPEAGRVLAQFEHLLAQADLSCPSDDLLIRLLSAYAEQGNWDRFWDVWSIPPRHAQARSTRLYARLFHIFAKDGHRARCIHALRRCYYEMAREEPPVQITSTIRVGLRKCIQIADPGAEDVVRELAYMEVRHYKKAENREFVNMLLEVRRTL